MLHHSCRELLRIAQRMSHSKDARGRWSTQVVDGRLILGKGAVWAPVPGDRFGVHVQCFDGVYRVAQAQSPISQPAVTRQQNARDTKMWPEKGAIDCQCTPVSVSCWIARGCASVSHQVQGLVGG